MIWSHQSTNWHSRGVQHGHGGNRSDTEKHRKAIEERGCNDIATVDIMLIIMFIAVLVLGIVIAAPPHVIWLLAWMVGKCFHYTVQVAERCRYGKSPPRVHRLRCR